MTDILDVLRSELKRADDECHSVEWGMNEKAYHILEEALTKAIAEIERLRGLAGAVSEGRSFVQIKPRSVIDMAFSQPWLKDI